MKNHLRFTLSLGIFLLISLFSVSAQSTDTFSVSITPIENQIIVNETASFEVTIFNGYPTEREFRLEKVGYPFWDMYVLPLSNPITLLVGPNKSESFTLYVRPLHITSVDTYSLDPQIIDDATGIRQVIPITVGIKSIETLIGGYVPTVLTSVDMPRSLDPREELKIGITLNNQNLLDYSDIVVRVSGDLVNEEMHYALGPKEEKRVEILKSFDPLTPPQDDSLVISVLRDGKSIINPITRDFSIEEYVIKDETPEQSRLLRTQKKIHLSSNNPSYDGEVKVETTSFKHLFTSTSPKASYVNEEGEKYLVWSVVLDDSLQTQITITQNYRPLVIIFVVILILGALYFVFRSPIIIIKEVASVHTREGGISEMKVILRLKNRGKETLKDIEIGDIVPHIASVEKELSLGTLHPEKISHHEKHGSVIKWVIPQLEPHEGVVLSYKLKSRLTILGEFNLPSATARCKSGNSYVMTNSNRVVVNG